MDKPTDSWQKLYESLASRTEALERENSSMRVQLLLAEAKAEAHGVDRAEQSSIIHQEITRLNAQLQEEREEITRLRKRLRELGERCDAN